MPHGQHHHIPCRMSDVYRPGRQRGEPEQEDIEKLWYNANLIFPSDCTFSTVRECVEMTADMLGFSEEKKDCIEAAFDEVGIDGSRKTVKNILRTWNLRFLTEREPSTMITP